MRWTPHASRFVFFSYIRRHTHVASGFSNRSLSLISKFMNNARLEFALVQFMLWKCCPEDSSLTPSRKIDLAERVHVFSPRSIMLRDVWRGREVNKSRFYSKFHVTLHHGNIIALEFNENVALLNVRSNNNFLFIYISDTSLQVYQLRSLGIPILK